MARVRARLIDPATGADAAVGFFVRLGVSVLDLAENAVRACPVGAVLAVHAATRENVPHVWLVNGATATIVPLFDAASGLYVSSDTVTPTAAGPLDIAVNGHAADPITVT